MSTPDARSAEVRGQRARLLLGCGVAVAPLFLSVAVVQMVVRPGFDLTRHAVSSLQNGDFGWVQSASFVLCGLLSLLCAWGLREVMRGTPGGAWGPVLAAAYGVGMVVAGVFAPDPALGFPPGAPEGPPEAMSVSGGLHTFGFFLAFAALVAACFVLSRHFGKKMPAWRNAGLVVGIVTPLLITLGTAALPHLAGILYLVAGGAVFAWLSAVAWRLLVGTEASAPYDARTR